MGYSMHSEVFLPEALLGPLNDVERKHAPTEFFFAGDTTLLRLSKVSIVGTRNPSPVGIELTEELVRAFCLNHICIVSGLAAGIDTVAHKTAIAEAGRTIAVIGTPLDQVYPRANRSLQQQIMKEHLAVSQFAPGSAVTRKNFPLRNRTMALISDATLIIEASEKSGTEHQGWEALRLGRPLFVTGLLAKRRLPWVEKLIHYGATILPDNDISVILDAIPAPVPDEQAAAAL